MAIEVDWYGLGMLAILEAYLSGKELKLALIKEGYTPNRDTHDFWNDVSAEEVAEGGGYTTGGEKAESVAAEYDSASDQVRLDLEDITWEFTESKTWQYGVLYHNTGEAATSTLLGLLEWDSAQSVSTTYTLTFDAAGLLFIDTT